MNSVKKVNYPWLDLMRYVAALLVVLGHFRAYFFVNYDQLPASQHGALMQIIYVLTSLGHSSVLSGYLVGWGGF